MICLALDSSSFAASQAPPRAVDEGSFVPKPCLMGMGEPMEEDVEMMHLEDLETDSFCSEDEEDLDSTCQA